MGLLKRAAKRLLLGPAGGRVRNIRLGLNRGLRFELDAGTKAMRLLGLDERELDPTIRSWTARARVAVDVGANDGWYSLFFATRSNVQVTHAFEPDRALRERLRGALALNGVPEEKVRIHSEFVGNVARPGWCRLDDVLREEEGPFVVKIDVEGGEVDALLGAERLLSSGVCWLVIETHGRDLEASCLELLQRSGHDARVIDAAWYRRLLPEQRTIAHNRWIVAEPRSRI